MNLEIIILCFFFILICVIYTIDNILYCIKKRKEKQKLHKLIYQLEHSYTQI